MTEHILSDDCPCGPTVEHVPAVRRTINVQFEGRCGNCDALTNQLPCPSCIEEPTP